MNCACVRHTALPHTTQLFADVLYQPDLTAAYYRHPIRDLDAYRAAAGEVRFTDAQRAALVKALQAQNAPSRNLERLANPGTVAVVTGQQVGLFSGPAYTVFKALHAAKLAEWLTASGIPAVPLFWLATEDHDFAEVNHVWVFDAAYQPHKLEMRRTANSQPVGGVTLADPPVRELRKLLHGMPFGEEVAERVEESYRAGSTMGKAFGELVGGLLASHDILQVDPMLPEFRKLAAPALARAVKAGGELNARVLARNQQLADAGYHAQVHVEEQTSFVFLLEGGKRLALRRHGDEYGLNGRTFTIPELMDRAEQLSPNALLRPVVQDSMIPTVAYIGGPAEVAYLAQSETLYSALLDRMPVAAPRAGFTIIDAASEKRMNRYGLELPELFHGDEALRARIASRLVPEALAGKLHGTVETVDRAVEAMRRELLAFDPTLAKALEKSARKVHHQFARIEGKAAREAMRRDERAARDAASLGGLVYPERHLQERLYSFLPFLAKHGMELLDQVYDAIDVECPDHRLMVV